MSPRKNFRKLASQALVIVVLAVFGSASVTLAEETGPAPVPAPEAAAVPASDGPAVQGDESPVAPVQKAVKTSKKAKRSKKAAKAKAKSKKSAMKARKLAKKSKKASKKAKNAALKAAKKKKGPKRSAPEHEPMGRSIPRRDEGPAAVEVPAQPVSPPSQ